MQFSDLTKAVQDAWRFAWPPLVLCEIFYLVSSFLDPDGTRQSIQWMLATTKDWGIILDNLRPVLEPYGLTKLIPAVSVVAVIGFLYLLNGPITSSVSKLPPHLSYTPVSLIVRQMSEEDKLALVRKYPTSRSVEAAYHLALEQIRVEKGASATRAEIFYKMQNFLKFALASVVILSIVSTLHGAASLSVFGRFLITLSMLSCLWLIILPMLLYQEEQQFFDDWRAVQIALQAHASGFLEDPITKAEQEKISTRDQSGRWWRVYMVNHYWFIWLKRTFFLER